jgi:hypothetical protein
VGSRLRFTGLIAALAVGAALCLPAAALAANSFTWNQPGDFTASGSGANPEHKYGEPSWSYSASNATLAFASGFTGDGNVGGWVDSSASPTTWIAVPTGGSPSALQMVPAQGQSVRLTWTSPFPASEAITVSGSVAEPNFSTGLLSPCAGTSWTLSNGGTTVASGSGAATATIDTGGPVTVASGGTLALTVTDASALLTPYSTTCDETNVALSLSAAAPGSAVTLTSPTANQTFTDSQPTFAGAAGDGFGYNGQVKVKVYGGSSASGTAAQTLTTTESGGSWSVAATSLENGTYTAQAEQDDVVGNADLSSPVTFTLNNPAPPTVTLNSLGAAPLSTSTPTLAGTAGTATGDSKVSILIYTAGSSPRPVQYLAATPGADGSYSVEVSPALLDGQYQAIAYQVNSTGGLGQSTALVFSIKLHAPVVTLATPGAGASLPQHGATFSGLAGHVYGDGSTVAISLWRGTSDHGQPFGTAKATVSGTTWSLRWPHTLALGLYTVQASQSDDAGHTTHTAAHTFLVVPSSTTIGDWVTLSHGVASLPVSCLAPAGSQCTGTVLVLTAKAYRPTSGGPSGRLRVLFAYVTIPGGQTAIVRRSVKGAVKRLLTRKAPLSVHVTATLSSGGAKAVTNNGTRTLKLGS